MTGYVVHYSDGDTDRTESVAASSNHCNLTHLSRCLTYRILVEATSEHLSGVSNEWNITLGMKNIHCSSYILFRFVYMGLNIWLRQVACF